MSAHIKAVVFDFFFTLANPNVHARTTVAELLARHGSDLAAEDVIGEWFRGDRPDLERALDGEAPTFVSFRQHWSSYGAELLQRFGLPPDADGWAGARCDAHCRSDLFDDVAPTLDELRRRGLPIGVMSDADDDFLLPCIDAVGLQFDAVVTSEGMQCYKPHRCLFDTVCAQLGVAPTEAVYVGDNPKTDIVGARNAGMTSVWINRNQRQWPAELEPPDFTIASLSELTALL